METINWMKYQKTRVLIPAPPFLAGWTSQPSLSVPPPTCHVSFFQKHSGALMKRKKGRNCFQYENVVFKVFQPHWPELIDIPHCIYSGLHSSFLSCASGTHLSGDWDKHWEGRLPTVEVKKATKP